MNARLEQLFVPYRRNDAPGCIVGVAHQGELVYRGAFGMANVEHGVANTPATRMPVASITKHFTCAAALRLAAERKLDLEEPIERWVPELTEQQRKPTLRQLMTHTSGLRCYIDHAVFDGFALMPAGRPAALQCRLTEVNFPAGYGMSYSNAGYMLLTWAIERAAGAPLEDVLRDGIFADAGLQSTSLPRWDVPVKAGLGLITKPWRGLRLVHHAGTFPGVTAQFLTIPDEALDVVVLFNRPAPAVDLGQKIVAVLLEGRLQEPLPAPVAASYPSLLGQYVAPDTGVLFSLADKEGQLALSQFGGSPVPLETRPAAADHWPFGADVGGGDLLFRPCPQSENGAIEYLDRSGWHVARRIKGEPMSAPEVVQAAPDAYHSDCAAATLRFLAKDAELEVIVSGEYGVGHYPAVSVGPDLIRFWAPGLAPGMLIRLERDAGVVKRVIVSTPRTRATVFQRVAVLNA